MKSYESRANQLFDLHDAQAKLNALPGTVANEFFDAQWTFVDPKNKIYSIDFNEVNLLVERFSEWNELMSLDLMLIAKLMFLDTAKSNVELFIPRFKGIMLFWAGLAEQHSTRLTPVNLHSFLHFFLTSSWNKGEITRSIKLNSIVKFRRIFSIDTLKYTLHSLGLNDIVEAVNNTAVRKALKELIPEITNGELTYSDWTDCGTYDNLTLDYGQYYVEHCLAFFEKHIALATAIAATIRSIPEFAKAIDRNEDSVRVWTMHFLEGKSPDEILDALAKNGIYHSNETIARLNKIVLTYFRKIREKTEFLSKIMEKASLKQIISLIGVQPNDTNIDRFGYIIWKWITENNEVETAELLKNTIPAIDISIFLREIESFRNTHHQSWDVPTQEDYADFGLREVLSRDTNNRYPRQLVRLVEYAGLTCLVALTGWRKSEFGFPISMLKSFPNKDILDQYSFPYRYQVDWHVFKTSGKVRELREVTFNIAVLIERIHELIAPDATAPCLFRINKARRDLFNSDAAVYRAVGGLWSHYVQHYEQFKVLDIQNSCATEVIDGTQSTLSDELTNCSDHLAQSVSTNAPGIATINSGHFEAWQRARREFPIINFFFTSISTIQKENWVLRYRNRTLNPDLVDLLSNNLSTETIGWISTLSDGECKSQTVSRAISAELVEHCLYPSPHAFRHMWAEAVYRRFDGDAGWMIRSQFKHISQTMWLSYIRDKDNRGAHRSAKLRVVSSLVYNYFQRKGKGYTGQLHTWLRRLSRKTSVLTHSEQEDFLNQIVTVEISDVKTSAWGYCLLKKRTAGKARCAESGIPQRHNASPSLCLGCAHNLMQSGNVEWILIHIQTHIESLKNPIVPDLFKNASYELLKNSIKHIKNLNPQHEALPELEETIKHYLAGIKL